MDGITFSIAIVDANEPSPSGGGPVGGGKEDAETGDFFQMLLAQALMASLPGQTAAIDPVVVGGAPQPAATTAPLTFELGRTVSPDGKLNARLVRVQTGEGRSFEAILGSVPLPIQPERQVFDVTDAVRLIAEATEDASNGVSSTVPKLQSAGPAVSLADALHKLTASTVEPPAPTVAGKPVAAPVAGRQQVVPVQVVAVPVAADPADRLDSATSAGDSLVESGPAGNSVRTTPPSPDNAAEPGQDAELDIDVEQGQPIATHRLAEQRGPAGIERPPAQPAVDLVRQVVDQVRQLGVEGKSQVSLQLQPESLGRLDVRISIEDGNVTVQLGAQNTEVKGLIESNLQQLRSALADQGLRVDRLVVYVGQSLTGFDGSPRQQQAWETAPRNRRGRIDEVEAVGVQPAWWGSATTVDYRV